MRKKIKKICKSCEKEYKGFVASLYCSLKCANIDNKTKFQKGLRPWNTGKKHSEETRKKISFNRKGKRKGIIPKNFEMMQKLAWEAKRGKKAYFKNPEERNKKISESHKGIKLSEETKRKQSEARIGFYQNGGVHPRGMLGKTPTVATRKKMSESSKGDKAYNYKGGRTENNIIRQNVEYRLWRESIFARDNWTCQKCFKKGNILRAHHIFNFAQYPELRFAIDNGITLCNEHHKEFHKIYSNKNNTKEQIIKYLTPQMA